MRYRFYEDLYNHQYRWSTERSDTDGKFVACIYKLKSDGFYSRYTLSKEMRFNKRKTAKAWCNKNHAKAVARQRIVINDREKRKKERIALKPVYTKLELKQQKAQKDVERLKKNIARADTKMKTLTTRKKTYEKKVKQLMRKLDAIPQ